MTTNKNPAKSNILIGIAGPCGAGKSTLVQQLQVHGFQARAIVQEHSYVPDMWKRITRPDFLIFLQASWKTSTDRRKLNWTEPEWQEQQRRLAHAKMHADLVVDTDDLEIEQVLDVVLRFLEINTNR
jgi:deoxyadenosine/deoxycytidine kinase